MARRLFTLLILVLVLFLVLWLASRVAGLHAVVQGEPGALLYAAAFDERGGWSEYDDGRLTAQIADGALTLHVNQADSAAFSAGPYFFADVMVSARARAVEGPLDNGFGLMLSLTTQDNSRLDDDAYLLFLVSSDGYYSVRQRLNGVERELSTWIPSPAVAQGFGTDNLLQAALSGGEASFSVNGTPLQFCIPNSPDGVSTFYLDECIDGTLTSTLPVPGMTAGQVGVVALATATGGPGVVVDFDHLLVFAP